MKTRIQARVIALNPKTKSVLLARNPGKDFWYAPGGGLEEGEDLKQCAIREMEEETGLHITPTRLLYVQEIQDTKEDTLIIELFWLAELGHGQELDAEHVDLDPDGGIEEAKWFTKEQLQNMTAFPEQLKDSFWADLEKFSQIEDPFLGTLR